MFVHEAAIFDFIVGATMGHGYHRAVDRDWELFRGQVSKVPKVDIDRTSREQWATSIVSETADMLRAP